MRNLFQEFSRKQQYVWPQIAKINKGSNLLTVFFFQKLTLYHVEAERKRFNGRQNSEIVEIGTA